MKRLLICCVLAAGVGCAAPSSTDAERQRIVALEMKLLKYDERIGELESRARVYERTFDKMRDSNQRSEQNIRDLIDWIKSKI